MATAVEPTGELNLSHVNDSDNAPSCESSLPASTPATSVADTTSFDSAPLSPKFSEEGANSVKTVATNTSTTTTTNTIATTESETVALIVFEKSPKQGVETESSDNALVTRQPEPAPAPKEAPEAVAEPVSEATVDRPTEPVQMTKLEENGKTVAPVQDMVIDQAPVADASMSSPPPEEESQPTPVETALAEPVEQLHDPLEVRPRRSRASIGTYNLARLSGTAGHGKRLANGDSISARSIRRRSAAAAAKAAAGLATGTDADASPSALHVYNVAWGSPAAGANGAGDGSPATGVAGANGIQQESPTTNAKKVTKSVKAPKHLSAKKYTPKPPHLSASTGTMPKTAHQADSSKPVGDPVEIAYALGKRMRQSLEEDPAHKMKRELRRLQDTDEFHHKDTRPVLQTVWSKGKLVTIGGDETPDLDDDGRATRSVSTAPSTITLEASPPDPTPSNAEVIAPRRPKRQKTEPAKSKEKPPKAKLREAEVGPEPQGPQKRIKKYLDRGLYAGQPTPSDFRAGLGPLDRKELAKYPELMVPPKSNSVLPGPMRGGLKLMAYGRDYKLPFDVCHPSATQPKPDEWRNMSKNRFVGNAKDVWKKFSYTDSSKCVCTPETKCGESCENRSMMYECDETNCNIDREHCTNRSFADLMDRRNKGNKYRIGVEVIKTKDRGYGVRSTRCFEPGQIIMEYNGEIITVAECSRRMKEEYKDNECYYLMSFDQNMIIDATTGSIARFVNHSCNPNCQMIKWIVADQPRMALFAGDKPINTGDELTYDYNFDPFSAKNVQKCLCGESNCRGVLGPRARDLKLQVQQPPLAKATKSTKRKYVEDDDEDEDDDVVAHAKRRKVDVRRSVTTAKLPKGVSKVTATTTTTTTTTLKTKPKAAHQQFKRRQSRQSTSTPEPPSSGRNSTPLSRRRAAEQSGRVRYAPTSDEGEAEVEGGFDEEDDEDDDDVQMMGRGVRSVLKR